MKLLNYLNNFLFLTLILVGLFGIMVISHEAYHYFTIDGKAKGVCFGVCDLQGSYNNTPYQNANYATGAVAWEFNETQAKKFNLVSQEKGAWIFSLCFTGFFAIGLLTTKVLRK